MLKGSKVVSQFNFKCHRGSFEVHWEHILTIIDTLSEFSFFGFSIGPYGAMQKFRTRCTGGFRKYFFVNYYFNLLLVTPSMF